MSLSNPVNPPIVNEAVAQPVSTGRVIGVDENQTKVNQLHGIAVNNVKGAGIPKQVTNAQVSIANAQTGVTCTVSVLFKIDPTDKSFSGVNVWVKGYQGNAQLVQVASGTSSPCKFVLNNTGEIVSFTIQAFGNGGMAPLNASPSCSVTLPKSTVGGYGSSTQTSITKVTTSVQTVNQIAPADYMPFIAGNTGIAAAAISSGAVVANAVTVVQFTIPYQITVNHVSIFVVSGGGVGFATTAIYDSTGTNKLIDAGASAFDTHSASQVMRTASVGGVVLSPGTYWWATGSTDGAGSILGYINIYQYMPKIINVGSVLFGKAANGLSGGAMPSSLGAITTFGVASSCAVPLVWLYT